MNLKFKTEEELLTIQKLVEKELESRKHDRLVIRDKEFLKEFLEKYSDYEVAFFEVEEGEEWGKEYELAMKNKKLSVWHNIDVMQFSGTQPEDWYETYSKIIPADMHEVGEGVYEYRGTMEVEKYLNSIGFELKN